MCVCCVLLRLRVLVGLLGLFLDTHVGGLLPCFFACLLACLPACLLACLLARLLACVSCESSIVGVGIMCVCVSEYGANCLRAVYVRVCVCVRVRERVSISL